MSTTASLNSEYDFLPPENIRYGYDEDLLKKVISWQKRRLALLKKRATSANVQINLPGVLVVMDDILTASGKKGHMFSPTLKYLFCQSRHFKISIIFCSQLSKVIASPTIKAQSDYILVSQLSAEQLKAVHAVTSGKTMREFQSMIAGLENHNFMLYDTLKTSGDRWSMVRATGFADGKFRVVFANQKKKAIKASQDEEDTQKKCDCKK